MQGSSSLEGNRVGGEAKERGVGRGVGVSALRSSRSRNGQMEEGSRAASTEYQSLSFPGGKSAE